MEDAEWLWVTVRRAHLIARIGRSCASPTSCPRYWLGRGWPPPLRLEPGNGGVPVRKSYVKMVATRCRQADGSLTKGVISVPRDATRDPATTPPWRRGSHPSGPTPARSALVPIRSHGHRPVILARVGLLARRDVSLADPALAVGVLRVVLAARVSLSRVTSSSCGCVEPAGGRPHGVLGYGVGTATVGAVTVMISEPQADSDGLKAVGSVGVKSAVQ